MARGDGLKLRGSTWWIRFTGPDGRRWEESAKTSVKEEARALRQKRMHEEWLACHFPERALQDITLEELRALWLRDRAHKRSLAADIANWRNIFAAIAPTRLLATVHATDLLQLKEQLLRDHTPATLNRNYALLRAACNLAQEHGYRVPQLTWRAEKERNCRERICTPQEYSRIMAAADPELRYVTYLGYHTGCRLGELVTAVREGDLLLLSAEATKEGAPKAIPLPDGAKALEVPITASMAGLSHRFQRLTQHLGIRDLHFHDLRHTAITNMLRAGVAINTVAAISGHKTLRMLARYAHTQPEDLRAAMQRQVACYASESAPPRTESLPPAAPEPPVRS